MPYVGQSSSFKVIKTRLLYIIKSFQHSAAQLCSHTTFLSRQVLWTLTSCKHTKKTLSSQHECSNVEIKSCNGSWANSICLWKAWEWCSRGEIKPVSGPWVQLCVCQAPGVPICSWACFSLTVLSAVISSRHTHTVWIWSVPLCR